MNSFFKLHRLILAQFLTLCKSVEADTFSDRISNPCTVLDYYLLSILLKRVNRIWQMMPRFSGLKNLKSRKTTIFLVVTLGKSCVTCFNIYQRKSLKNNLINKQASLKDMQTQNFIPVSDPPTEQGGYIL